MDKLMESKITVRKGKIASLVKSVATLRRDLAPSAAQVIRVSIFADGPVRVIRFQDDDTVSRKGGDAAAELWGLRTKIRQVNTELLTYQEKEDELINVLLGKVVRLCVDSACPAAAEPLSERACRSTNTTYTTRGCRTACRM